MDGRVSDFDDISLFFMKIQKESCSRLGSKNQHKLFWRLLSSCMPQEVQTWLGYNFFMTKYGIIWVIMDMASAKSDVNGPMKKCFLAYCNKKRDKNTNQKMFKNV